MLTVGGNNSSTSFSGTIGMTNQGYDPTYGRFAKTGTGTLTIDNATFALGETYIAQGAMAQTSGNASFAYLSVGENKTGGVPNVGALNVSGGTLTIGTTLQVGSFGGNGTVNQTGGTVKVIPLCGTTAHCAALNIGNQGGTGTYAISGGELIASIVNIGRNTGSNPGSTGTLAISGGGVDISTRSDGNGGILNGRLIIGYSAQSNGKIEQTGGTLRIHNDSMLYLTGQSTSTSIYNLNGGTLEIGGNSLQAAYSNSNPHYQFNLGGGSIKVIESALMTNVNAILTSGVSTIDTNGFGATWNGVFSGGGGLAKTGIGALTLSGVNTYSGGTFLNGGVLKVNADNNLGAAAGGLTFNGGTLQYGAAFSTARNITLTGGGTIDTNGFNATVSGQLSGQGALTKTGAGTLTLSGGGSYSGAASVNQGALRAGATNAFSPFSAYSVASAATLDLNSLNQTIGSLAGAGDILLGSATLTTGGDGTSTTFSGLISGTGGLTKEGAGTFTLTGSNAYTGGTTISGGLINFNSANNFGPSGTITLNGGGLQWASGNTTDISFRLAAMGIGGATFDTNGNDVIFATSLSGVGGGLIKSGLGTLTLVANNTGPIAVTGGTLQAGQTNAFSPLSAFTVASAATFDLNNLNQTIGSLAGAGNVTLGSATLTTGGDDIDTIFSGVISGTGSLTKVGNGKFTLAGDNTYTGQTTIQAGQLIITGSIKSNILSNTTFELDTSGTSTVSGVLSGSGSVDKTGAGTTVLSNVNTYTGATSVSEGKLVVNGSITSSSGLTVGQGAVIGGNGFLPSATINGELSPGNSIGMITVNGDLTLGAGSQYLVEVSPTAADRTNVTGAATLAGTVLATFASGSYIVKNYTILHADGGFAGSTFSGLVTANAPANFITSLNYTSNDVLLSLTANLGGDIPGGVSALPRNQRGVANVINAWFNAGLPLAPNFINLYSLTGTGLTNALASSAGEPATGAQQVGYRSLGHFLYQMLDLQGPSRGQSQTGDAGGFIASYTTDEPAASKTISLSHANLSRSPPPNASVLYEPRWSIWASSFGGYGHLGGDSLGSGAHGLASSIVGMATGLDYRLTPQTVLGVSMAGGGTNWSLSEGLGSGRSDFLQTGVYGLTYVGPAYVSAAFAFANHWMSTQRAAAFGDVLTANFSAQNYGGRVEGGYRFATALGGLTPYTAIQPQSFRTPGYGETDSIPAGFGLNYRGRSSTDTRGELGSRFDHIIGIYRDALIMLRGRVAYAHDWVSNATLATAFAALPGAGFTVEGAKPVKNTALLTTAAELRLPGGAALFAKFDGEFSHRSQMYYGSAGMRYSW